MAAPLTKSEYAYVELRDLILIGELEPGAPIPQARIAERIGVSMTPFREAIKRLAGEGMVDLTAHRDARVTPLKAEEAAHLDEVRTSLDPLAASLAAGRREAADLARMQDTLSRLEPIRDGSDLQGMLAHREFHRSVYRAAHNPVLSSALDHLWDQADRYRALALRVSPMPAQERARVSAEHQALFEAVRDGQPERAAEVMRQHIQGSHGRRVISLLERDRPTA